MGPAPNQVAREATGAILGVLVLCVAFDGSAVLAAQAQRGAPVELLASGSGFRPSTITARRGELLRLTVRAEDGEHCFALDAFRIEKRLRPGRPVTIEITPDRTGSFEFYCCLEQGRAAEVERGRLTVVE